MNLTGSEKLRSVSVADYLAGEAVARRKHEYVDGHAYMKLPSLQVCILLEQDFPTAVVHRRIDSGFRQEILQGLDAVIALPTNNVHLPLAAIYAEVKFIAEPEESYGKENG